MSKKILLAFLIFFALKISAQIPVGTWRDQFSYRQASGLAIGEKTVYIATELALFEYDTEDNTTSKLSKLNGLSDAGISCIAYNSATKSLLIAYTNSNIDVLKNGRIYNLPELKNKQISGDKNINRIEMLGHTAYLACGFGIVVFDTETLEFSDTYFIGEDAGYVSVNDIDFDNNYIYAATKEGLMKCDLALSYPGDYRNWSKIRNIPHENDNFGFIKIFNEDIIFFEDEDANGYGNIYKIHNNAYSAFDNSMRNVRDMQISENQLIISDKTKVKIYNSDGSEPQLVSQYELADSTYTTSTLSSAQLSSDGTLYITDREFGLIKKSNEYFEQILPNGPYNNQTGKLSYSNNTIYSATSTVAPPSAQQNHPAYFNRFETENWNFYKIAQAKDVITVLPFKSNTNHVLLSTWGGGIYEYENDTELNHYTVNNSLLQSVLPENPDAYTRVFDLKFGQNEDVWITNDMSVTPLCLRTFDGNWYGYELSYSGNHWIRNLLVRENGDVWIDLYRNGLYCFNNNATPENTDDDLHRNFYPINSEGDEYEQEIRSFAQDKNGTIWVGTIQGIFVYYEPDLVFSEANFFAERIKVTSEYFDETSTHYLLETEVITDIEIDGANRKWIGTESAGVFLLSDNGKTEVHNFNVFNSPLISNTITDIEINDKTGEVFVATDKGILSFRSDATEAGAEFGNVYAFPNPVRPGYDGVITITGLALDMNVKFTDISGALVYETDALGGQAVWDGKRFDGSVVSSGVYLYFCTNPDGTQTHVGKILFIK